MWGRFAGLSVCVAVVVFGGGCGVLSEIMDRGTSDRNGSRGSESGEATTGADSNAVTGIEGVRDAVVYIEARGGVFDDLREFGTDNLAGTGSGFIVDGDEGLVVTNNHVVTGASYLEVYLDGQEEPVDARVLGASECSDLALLKLEGTDLPYLEWRRKPPEAGMDIRAAGYPGEDVASGERPDYTITSGTVTTTEADGETQWASVDSVVEHDALIRGGDSGGPLVDETGKVVGINYAGTDDADLGFAIDSSQAQGIIDRLEEGDIEGIGVNGQAFIDPESSYSSIDVYSTKTGSPAAEVGIENPSVNPDSGELTDFDSIIEIEDTRLGEQGTMEEYCNIIRQHEMEDPLSITVERYRGGQYESTLKGVLNGGEDDKLEVVETAEADTSDTSGSSGTSDYTEISNEAGTLAVEVPSSWTDINDNSQWSFQGQNVGPSLSAAPDLEAYNNNWNQPGFFLGASSSLAGEYTVDTLLDSFDASDACTYDARYDYPSDGTFTGKYDLWTNCDGTGASFYTLAVTPDDGSQKLLLMQTSIVTNSDLDVLDRLETTFNVAADI